MKDTYYYNPRNNVSGIQLDPVIMVTFDQPMDANSVAEFANLVLGWLYNAERSRKFVAKKKKSKKVSPKKKAKKVSPKKSTAKTEYISCVLWPGTLAALRERYGTLLSKPKLINLALSQHLELKIPEQV